MMKTTIFCMMLLAAVTCAKNIDPYESDEQYVWAENVGWLNFEPATSGVQVYTDHVEGFVWAENVGWINLSPTTYGGVLNDGDGGLSGFAWAENVGWINFDPDVPGDTANQYKVVIDADGYMSGWAWGENIGWIHVNETQSWAARVCVVTLEDLTGFASYWLTAEPAANLDETGNVDMADFAAFAAWWKTYCPDGWQLK